MNTYCEKCNKEYRNCNFKKHKCSKDEIKFKIDESWKIGDKYKCPECSKIFSKKGLISHYYRKHDERGISFLEERYKNSKKANKVKLTKNEISKILSDSMKKCHSEGRHPGWSHINLDKNRRSYPEKFFIEVFKDYNLYDKYQIEEKYPYGKYFLDFLFIEIKLVVEIDGSQHYRDNKAIEHDKIRDSFLIKNGFKVFRIKWLDVIEDKGREINELLSFIENVNNETTRYYVIDDIKTEKTEKYCTCGNKIKTKKSKICNICRSLNNRIVKERPNYETLSKDIDKLGYLGTGRKYGVSDTSIRKWLRKYMEE